RGNENREAQRRAVMGSAFKAMVMTISTQNHLDYVTFTSGGKSAYLREAHMNAQRGRQNLGRWTRRAIAPPRLAAALLTAALAASLAACSGGGSVDRKSVV